MHAPRDTTKPFYVAVPRGGQGVTLDSFKATLNNNKSDYWILGKPQPYTKPPESQLFERAHCVAIVSTTSHLERANARFAQRRAAEINQGGEQNPKKKEQKQGGPQAIVALERQLEEAEEASRSLALSLEEEQARANKLQKECEKLEAAHKEATSMLELTKSQLNNTCEALNPSGEIGECHEIVSKIAASSSEVERQKFLTLYQAVSKADKLQSEKKMLESEKKMLETEKKLIESENRTLNCMRKTSILIACGRMTRKYVPTVCRMSPALLTISQHHALISKPLGFQLNSAAWLRIAHHFSGGTVFIPAGALLDTEQKLVCQLAKYLKLDTEIIPETP
ncbi:hypothetical protein QOT17_015334 [Balamuthia mandrillaris]